MPQEGDGHCHLLRLWQDILKTLSHGTPYTHNHKHLYPCPDCGHCFTNSAQFISHWQGHSGVHLYACVDCGHIQSPGNLICCQHVHSGNRPFACAQRRARFYHQENLVQCQLLHTGEKPYHCPDCGHRFWQSGSLAVHWHTHTGNPCPECEKHFLDSSSLTKHQQIDQTA